MDPGETTAPDVPATAGRRPPIVWSAVLTGAGVGLAVLIVVATARAVLDREVTDFDETGWTLPLFVLLVVGYFAAGWVAQGRAAAAGVADAPFTHGTLAGLGAFVAWIPLRIAIWAVRDEHRGLLRGSDAALRPGQVLGALVIAAGFGLLGAYVGTRRAARADSGGVDSGGVDSGGAGQA